MLQLWKRHIIQMSTATYLKLYYFTKSFFILCYFVIIFCVLITQFIPDYSPKQIIKGPEATRKETQNLKINTHYGILLGSLWWVISTIQSGYIARMRQSANPRKLWTKFLHIKEHKRDLLASSRPLNIVVLRKVGCLTVLNKPHIGYQSIYFI